MKVIKKGSENDSFGKELTCKGSGLGKGKGGCGAILLVKPCDVMSSSYDGDTSYWFVCPECGAHTYVSYTTFK